MKLNKIYNEDAITFMKRMPKNKVSLICTSPPYNVGIEYDSHNDSMKWKDYVNWCRTWLSLFKRVLKPDGRFAINVPLEIGLKSNANKRVSPFSTFLNLIEEVGLNYSACPVWSDNNITKLTAWGSWMSASSPYIYCPYEVVIIGYNKVWKKEKKGTSTISKSDFIKGCSGVWNVQPETKGLTVANFPVKLPKLCIELLTYKNDIVCDPFSGSATTAIAAIQTGRRFIGSEISKKYWKIGNRRINEEIEDEKLRIFK